jgi:hypothetical protein
MRRFPHSIASFTPRAIRVEPIRNQRMLLVRLIRATELLLETTSLGGQLFAAVGGELGERWSNAASLCSPDLVATAGGRARFVSPAETELTSKRADLCGCHATGRRLFACSRVRTPLVRLFGGHEHRGTSDVRGNAALVGRGSCIHASLMASVLAEGRPASSLPSHERLTALARQL